MVMSEILEIEIPEGMNERLDKALAALVPKAAALSRSRLQELIQSGRVFQGDKVVRDNKYKTKSAEVFRIKLPPPLPSPLTAEDIPLEILYQDEDIAIVNKPAGMVVHPSASTPSGTMVNALLFHIGESLSGVGGVERPGIVHRIDKDTSGLLVVAKNDRAHNGLGQQFRAHSIERIYDAYTYGALRASEPRVLGLEGVSQESATLLRVDLPIGRHKTDRLRMAIRPDGRHAVTHIQIDGHDHAESITRVQCQLETGRTHQIRVHLNHLGFPLLGDPIYGKGSRQLPKTANPALVDAVQALKGQALHARVLGFIHPITGHEMRYEIEPPTDRAALAVFITK